MARRFKGDFVCEPDPMTQGYVHHATTKVTNHADPVVQIALSHHHVHCIISTNSNTLLYFWSPSRLRKLKQETVEE